MPRTKRQYTLVIVGESGRLTAEHFDDVAELKTRLGDLDVEGQQAMLFSSAPIPFGTQVVIGTPTKPKTKQERKPRAKKEPTTTTPTAKALDGVA